MLAEGTQLIDNERVRVTEWRFAPGATTGEHVHGFDYVVVPVTNGLLGIRDAAGENEAALEAGRPYYRRAGVCHDVRNLGVSDIVFLEIELKIHPLEEAT